MTLGQRVAVMRDGRILQVDAPQRLYEQPRDLFVAAFIGSPAMNLVEATIDGDEVAFGQFRVPLEPARRPPSGERASCSGSGRRASRTRRSRRAGCRRSTSRSACSRSSARTRTCSSGSTRRASRPRRSRPRARTRPLVADENALFTARLDPRTAASVGRPLRARGRSGALPLLRPGDGESLLDQALAGSRRRCPVRSAARARVVLTTGGVR